MLTVLVTGPTVTQDSPFSSLAVAVTFASTHFVYPRRDDQAELAWVAWLITKMVYPRTVTHLSINPARSRVTSLICPTTLPLSQTATIVWKRWRQNFAAYSSIDLYQMLNYPLHHQPHHHHHHRHHHCSHHQSQHHLVVQKPHRTPDQQIHHAVHLQQITTKCCSSINC